MTSSPSPVLPSCPLCDTSGGVVLLDDGDSRVVLVDSAEGTTFPGFCRVIWNHHVKEMTDLTPVARSKLMTLVLATEQAVRAVTHADKINLASFGNMVPHLHWHVIPRWVDDSHFPDAIWAQPRRPSAPRPAVSTESLRAALHSALKQG